jgi:serine phosphatase RsbU (regulator of sigma subunit)
MLSTRLPSVIDVLEKQHHVLAMDATEMATFALTGQVALDEAIPALRAGVVQLKTSLQALPSEDLTTSAQDLTLAFDQLIQGIYQQQEVVDQLGATNRTSADFAPSLEKLYALAHANVALSEVLLKQTELAIGIVMEHRKEAVSSSRQWLIGALLLGTFGNGYLFYGFYIGILKSVNALTRGTTAFCAGQHAVRIEIHSKDELLVLGTNFNTMAQEVEQLMGKIHSQNQVRERDLKVLVDALGTKNEVLYAVNERVQEELNLARSVQLAILPQQFPKESDWSVHACMHPARELGGDFYDSFALPNGRHGILVADVSGKGVGAAFFMAVSRTVLLDSAMAARSPAQVLALANDLLCTRNPMDLFVTACYGIYDPHEGTLVYACAGHMPPLVRHAQGEIETLSTTNDLALGVMPQMPYSEHCLTLAPGDTLLMYTDGITEAFSSQGRAFGDARLKAWLSGSQPHRGTQWMVEDLVQHVADFVDGAEASDDLTCLFLCRSGLSA